MHVLQLVYRVLKFKCTFRFTSVRSGALQISGELDREVTHRYRFVVKATDGGNKVI